MNVYWNLICLGNLFCLIWFYNINCNLVLRRDSLNFLIVLFREIFIMKMEERGR